jgi:hypothetical protein
MDTPYIKPVFWDNCQPADNGQEQPLRPQTVARAGGDRIEVRGLLRWDAESWPALPGGRRVRYGGYVRARFESDRPGRPTEANQP